VIVMAGSQIGSHIFLRDLHELHGMACRMALKRGPKRGRNG